MNFLPGLQYSLLCANLVLGLFPHAASKLGLGDVQAELDRISSRETDSDLPNANETPAADGQDT